MKNTYLLVRDSENLDNFEIYLINEEDLENAKKILRNATEIYYSHKFIGTLVQKQTDNFFEYYKDTLSANNISYTEVNFVVENF